MSDTTENCLICSDQTPKTKWTASTWIPPHSKQLRITICSDERVYINGVLVEGSLQEHINELEKSDENS